MEMVKTFPCFFILHLLHSPVQGLTEELFELVLSCDIL